MTMFDMNQKITAAYRTHSIESNKNLFKLNDSSSASFIHYYHELAGSFFVCLRSSIVCGKLYHSSGMPGYLHCGATILEHYIITIANNLSISLFVFPYMYFHSGQAKCKLCACMEYAMCIVHLAICSLKSPSSSSCMHGMAWHRIYKYSTVATKTEKKKYRR